MIGFLQGIVDELGGDYCFINVNGVGYRVFISHFTREKLTRDQSCRLYTQLNVREDALLLYGFSDKQERDLFVQLTGVNGVGPKVALAILSALNVDKFCAEVSGKRPEMLMKVPGIGKKTAERIILELHDKLKNMAAADGNAPDGAKPSGAPDGSLSLLDDAAQALAALGYSPSEYGDILRDLPESHSVETVIKAALKKLAGR